MDLTCVKSKHLMEAVQKNRQDEILTRLRLGDNVDTAYTMGRTALLCAAANSNLEAVSTLLMYSPNVQVCDTNGYSALHMACSRSGTASLQIIEKLVVAGIEINCVNKFGRSALHECVISNNVAGAKKILESGANKEMVDSEGRTARELAFSRDSLEMVELLASIGGVASAGEGAKQNKEEKKKDDTSAPPALGAVALPKKMTVEEEKEALKRRLAELEEDETKSLETRLKENKQNLEKTKTDYRKQRESARAEIFKLEQKIKVLQTEEEKKCFELEKEIDKLTSEIDIKKRGDRPEKNKDIESCLECPVCLDVCKPPLQVWQCPEGHIICGSCVDRPELRVCPQCRISLTGQLSRNRALEDLARKTFPREAEKEAKKKNRAGTRAVGNRQGQNRNRGGGGAGRRQAQVQSQVDQLINFSHLGMEFSSDFDDDSYDLTSELFLENVDDEFMPNFPSSISPPPSLAWRGPPSTRPRTSAMIQRINSIRLRNSPGQRRRISPEVLPGQRRRLSPASQFLATGARSPTLGSSPTSSPSSNSPTRLRANMSVNQRNSDQAIYGPHSRGRAGRFRRSNIEQRPPPLSRHIR
eukprot:GFUD01039204.1.p1 GENE.GFUD01039204.1~~GFUD01039204.1.p1  ORF type:complete len:586 (-),score=215.93 GFUD01039204.1:142-1899(-)